MLTKQKIQKIQKTLSRGFDERMPFIFSALGDPGRYKIFKLILKQEDACVTDVANVLGVSVPAVSQQFKVLERAGIVRKERFGQTVCYLVKREDPIIEAIIRIVMD